MTPTPKTQAERLASLHAEQPSRERMLRDGMRLLTAAEVAYLLGFADYRSAYREDIPKGRRGWLAKDVRRHIERDRTTPSTAVQSATRRRAPRRASEAAPWWGGDAA